MTTHYRQNANPLPQAPDTNLVFYIRETEHDINLGLGPIDGPTFGWFVIIGWVAAVLLSMLTENRQVFGVLSAVMVVISAVWVKMFVRFQRVIK